MTETRRTLCNRDCPDACSILATVENGRVTALRGDKSHPVTQGFLCHRTNQFLSRQYSRERLTRPLLKRKGTFVEIPWEEALDHAASKLISIREESGAEAIFHYRSGGSLGFLKTVCDYFFHQFGPVTVKRGDICSGAGEKAQELDFGLSDSNDLFDLENAKEIILWGKNVVVSSPHTIPVLKRARKNGARLTLIDPVHHQTASLCEEHIAPRPGGDLALALAVAHVLFAKGWLDPDAPRFSNNIDQFETLATSRSIETWCAHADVPTEVVHRIATKLAPPGPTTILVGWGMARRQNGGAIVRALDALGVITGNIGKPGAGVSYYFNRKAGISMPFNAGGDAAPRTVCEPLFAQDVLAANEPPIRAVWVTAGNPVAMLPDSYAIKKALESREFVVVVDSFMTDTAQCADLVLPTTTLLEDDDLLGAYGHHHIGASTPVVHAPADVRSDLEIVQGLAQRVGLAAELSGSARHWKRMFLPKRGPSLEMLERGAVRVPQPKVAFEGKQFATADKRANLLTTLPENVIPSVDAMYPLQLLSLSTARSQSSQWTEEPNGRAEVVVHPQATSVSDGAIAMLESRVGSLEVKVRHDHKQRRDVVIIPKGGHLGRGQCANALVSAKLTDLGEGGALYDEGVRISPV